MKKILFTLVAGLMLLTVSGLAQGEVDCKTPAEACQLIDPDRGDHQPAIRFNVSTAGIVHLEADIWGASACSGAPDAQAAGDLDLPEGERNVRIVFEEALPKGTVLSIIWRLGSCPATDCVTYTLGSDPGLCPMGAAADNYIVTQ